MPHYEIGFATIHDPSKLPEYIERVGKIIAAHGGEMIHAGPVKRTLEGSISLGGRSPDNGVIIRFPDEAAAVNMYNSPEYVALREFRKDMETALIVVVGEFGNSTTGS